MALLADIECSHCGISFTGSAAQRCRLRHGKHSYCSQKCFRSGLSAVKKKPFARQAVIQPTDLTYRVIGLTKGQVALVDAEDFERISKLDWSAAWSQSTRSFYAQSYIQGMDGRRRTIIMAREIMDAPQFVYVDHHNHDTLGNRKHNLRLATPAQNAGNRRGSGKSGIKGVYADGRKWRAQIRVNGKVRYLGSFQSPDAAARAYREIARKEFGEFFWEG